jgi:hypothetical protein
VEGHLPPIRSAIAIALSAIAAGGVWAAAKPGETFGYSHTDATQEFLTGAYVNVDYAYSIIVPAHMRALRPSAPSPQHGIEIPVPDSSLDQIWINAEYNTLLFRSEKAASGSMADKLSKQYALRIFRTNPTKLGGLDAMDVVLSNERNPDRDVTYLRFIIALRQVPGEVGILYTAGIREHVRRPASDELFAEFVSSFRLRPTPK